MDVVRAEKQTSSGEDEVSNLTYYSPLGTQINEKDFLGTEDIFTLRKITLWSVCSSRGGI